MEKLTGNKLADWQGLYTDAKHAYDEVIAEMDDNEQAYLGTRKIKKADGKTDAEKQTSNVRKMVYELVESQVDTVIPMPKVTSLIGNEDRAQMIEAMLRNELDRLDTEEFIDEQARITPMLGGSIFYLEWDNSIRTHYNVGKLRIKNLHPKQLIPQKGVYKLDDMDYIFLTFEQTKRHIQEVYGVDVTSEGDEDEENPLEHMATHIFCYYKNGNGGIGLFSFVGNTVVQDYKDYFARHHEVCSKCGTPRDGDKCSKCGSTKFKDEIKKEQEFDIETTTIGPDGQPIPTTEKIKVPYYVFNEFPVVIHKNITYLNKFLGLSDVNMIKDQQNDASIYMTKIREKLLKGGSVMTKSVNTQFDATDEELKIVDFENPAEAQMFGVHNLQGDVSHDINLLDTNYMIARQTIGITDSFQGRSDRTATSGKAKGIAVEQTKGRLESKGKLKDFAFSKLFEKMFKFILSFTDEAVPYVKENTDGSKEYRWFDKKFFIEQDPNTNKYYYDDMFTFSVDIAGTLANDRQAMWQETRSNFESGAYGDPTAIDTLVMYWTTMNKLHYPGSVEALDLLKQRQIQQQEMMLQQQRDAATAQAFTDAKIPQLMKENEDLNMQIKDMKDDQLRSKKQEETQKVDSALSDLGL